MKLIEYKPHEKWAVWVHPCYLVEPSNVHWLTTYYFARTHISKTYEKLRKNKNVSINSFIQGLYDPFSNSQPIFMPIISTPKRTGKTRLTEYMTKTIKEKNFKPLSIGWEEANHLDRNIFSKVKTYYQYNLTRKTVTNSIKLLELFNEEEYMTVETRKLLQETLTELKQINN